MVAVRRPVTFPGACGKGHPRTPDNLVVWADGSTRCRRCRRDQKNGAGDPVDLSWINMDRLAAIDPADRSWRSAAACGTSNPRPEHTHIWFSTRGQNEVSDKAKAICEGCPVRLECLRAGMHERAGTWGGLSERQRRRLSRMVRTENVA